MERFESLNQLLSKLEDTQKSFTAWKLEFGHTKKRSSNGMNGYYINKLYQIRTKIANYGKGTITQVSGKTKYGKNFTIHLCNVKDEEVQTIIQQFPEVDLETPLQLRTIETKTLLTLNL